MATKKKLNEVTIITDPSSNDYLLLCQADGSLNRVKKSVLLPFTGSENSYFRLSESGWYRIVVGGFGNRITSGIINIGNNYNNRNSGSVCFYFSGSGYGSRKINTIGTNASLVTKARFIYQSSTIQYLYLDIFYSPTSGNDFYVSLSNSLYARLQPIELVTETPPEGYSVEEFIL